MSVSPRASGHTSLSPREIEVVRLVALGQPNKQIADRLGISPWTVATYVKRIYAKLGVNARAAMIAQVLGPGAFGVSNNT